MDIPLDRPPSDAEIAVGVAEGVLYSKFNPGIDLPYNPQEFLHHLGKHQSNFAQSFGSISDLTFRVAAFCWRLVGLGFFVPQPSGANPYHQFVATERGRAYLSGLDPSALTEGGLDAKMNAMGYAPSDIPRQYARLAHECFMSGFNGPAVVMLGAAAEAVTNNLADTMQHFLSKNAISHRQRGIRPTASANLTWLGEAVTNHRSNLRRVLLDHGKDESWIEPLSSVINGTGQAIRFTRNEAGHPTGLTFDQDDALELFQLFPRYVAETLKAIDALT